MSRGTPSGPGPGQDAGDDADPWAFLASRRPPRPRAADPPAAPDSPADSASPAGSPGAAVPGPADPPDTPPDTRSAADPLAALLPPASVRADRARGEIRTVQTGRTLRARAWPMALTLAMVTFAGFVTEMVGASQMIALAGPQVLVVMYPLGGLGLLAVGLLQFTVIDRRARLPMLRWVSLGYAAVFTLTLALILAGIVPVLATGAAWLLADQLNFLMPLLVWSLAGDEFNVAEGRRNFGWMVSWTYAGQVLGLTVATASPWLLDALGLPLPLLLVVDPLICVFIGLWLPRAMRGSAAAQGLARSEGLRASLSSAWDFISGVPAWRALFIASILVFVAGMTCHLSFMAGAGWLVGRDAGSLQTLLAGVSLVAFVLCWIIQATVAGRIQDRLGIPGTLFILTIAAVVAGLLLAAGAVVESVAVMAVGINVWRISDWTVDENARRGALALVPDERRARVAFFVELGPLALGLITSGLIAAVGLAVGLYWLPPLLAALVAAAAIPFSRRVVTQWEDSLLSWRLRRRKHVRGLDLP